MKHITCIKQSLLLVAAVLAAMLTGCIKDDLAECSKLTLKVEGLNGTDIMDITSLGLVEDATLYIFDENRKLLETRNLSKDFILAKEVIKLSGQHKTAYRCLGKPQRWQPVGYGPEAAGRFEGAAEEFGRRVRPITRQPLFRNERGDFAR